MRIFFALVGAVVVLATPALALSVQPGLWQDTDTRETNGEAQPPTVSTNCIPPGDAKDLVKSVQRQLQEAIKEEAQQCGKFDVEENGNVVVFAMKCEDPKQRAMDVTMTLTVHSPQSMSSVYTFKMADARRSGTTILKSESKWLSASCDKK